MRLVLQCNILSPSTMVVGQLRVTHIEGDTWLAEVGRNGLTEIGLHSAPFEHNEHEDNALALVRAAITALPEWAFDGETSSSDMARGQSGAGAEVQAWADRLRHNGPAFWRGQSEQPSGDEGG